MKRSRYTEEQIIGILKEQEAGVPVGELCCKHATFYNWKSKYGGLEVSEAKRLRREYQSKGRGSHRRDRR